MNEKTVIDHLVTSGSMEGERLERYISMVKNCQGEHSYIKDPFDRSIAMAFELVMQEHLNPWDAARVGKIDEVIPAFDLRRAVTRELPHLFASYRPPQIDRKYPNIPL